MNTSTSKILKFVHFKRVFLYKKTRIVWCDGRDIQEIHKQDDKITYKIWTVFMNYANNNIINDYNPWCEYNIIKGYVSTCDMCLYGKNNRICKKTDPDNLSYYQEIINKLKVNFNNNNITSIGEVFATKFKDEILKIDNEFY